MALLRTPPSDFLNATPILNADVYPRGGGKFTLTSNLAANGNTGIIGATITTSIREDSGFVLQLAPGGPTGVNDAITWTTIITPFSLVVLYGSRGGSRRIIMLGIVTAINETQSWIGGGVRRTIEVRGSDFGTYFKAFSYYELAYLALIQANLGAPGPGLGVAGYIFSNYSALTTHIPAEMGYLWLSLVMLGNRGPQKISVTPAAPNTEAVLEHTYITYKNHQQLIKDLFGFWIEIFDEGPAAIPFLTNFFVSEGRWMDKFLEIFPWPYYETFIITATDDQYPEMNNIVSGLSPNAVQSGSPTTGYAQIPATKISVPGYGEAFPAFIARVNPLPWTDSNVASGVQSWTHARWDALPLFDYSQYGFMDSTVGTAIGDIKNFYAIITSDIVNSGKTDIGLPLGFSIEQFGALLDRNSINSYGFMPRIETLMWFCQIVPSTSPPSNQRIIPMLHKLASYHEPTTVMLNGQVMLPFWPDLFPGSKFQYYPFKSHSKEDLFTFYVEEVRFQYLFGGDTSSTLTLSRGLRNTEYENQDLMNALHTGNAVRLDGKLQIKTDRAQGLTYYDYQNLVKTPVLVSPYSVTGKP